MKNNFKDKFKIIHRDSTDFYGTCRICGDDSEEWVYGTLKGRTNPNYYAVTNLAVRSSSKCSGCYKSPKKRFSKVTVKNCEVCDNVFVGKSRQKKYCSDRCRNSSNNLRNLKKYNLICEHCSLPFINNKIKKFCSDGCLADSRRVVVVNKECGTCSIEFSGTHRSKYCSQKCRPENFRKKIIKCMSCDTMVDVPKRKCLECKEKVNKPKMYEKVCPTCNKSFKTKNLSKIYCKASHSPSSKEAGKLRKRSVREAKLSVESWKNISDFKKNRPEGCHLDHIIPLNHPDVCGLHNTWNFQWLEPEENIYKSNKFDGTNENSTWKK